ncbi:MAG: hypothetical protein SV966_17660 [Actinomycetota bacterium]|nr:hypothetical protein [Actinomycetota bacterium]
MRPATALSAVPVVVTVKAVLIGWVAWGRAQMLGIESSAGQAGLTIATVALVIGLVCIVTGVALRRRDRRGDT